MQAVYTRGNPSFSRDFAILVSAVVFLLLLLSGWIVYETYNDHTDKLVKQLEGEATRIDRTLILEIEQSSYLLESLGRQILHFGPDDKEGIARLLRSFDTEDSVNLLFGWIDENQQLVVSSTRGVLDKGVDVSDRDYLKKSISTPWEIQIGRPIEGRLSARWILPIALGINDYTGHYMGTILVSIDIEGLTKKISENTVNSGLNFGIITKNFQQVTESSLEPDFIAHHFPTEMLSKLSLDGSGKLESESGGLLTYYQASTNYPFIMLLGISQNGQLGEFFVLLWQRLLPTLLIGVFILLILWAIRSRIIFPINSLSNSTDMLLRGEPVAVRVDGPGEIQYLGQQIEKIGSYITERRRIELEQRNKLSYVKKAKEAAELSNRVKVEFLSSMSHEIRTPLNTIAGFSEVMKNQVYGPIQNDRYLHYIDDIYQSSHQLQALIGDVLALAKAEADMLELQEKPISVPFIINKCIRVLGERLREAGVTVESRAQENMPRLLVDELRLKQIILNLLSNAIIHTPSGGTVIIEARLVKDRKQEPIFEIIFTDYGAKIMPLGSRASMTNQMDGAGRPRLRSRGEIGQLSNLGIPLTKALVAMHQATLEIESPPGKPTQVIVRFPKERIVS